MGEVAVPLTRIHSLIFNRSFILNFSIIFDFDHNLKIRNFIYFFSRPSITFLWFPVDPSPFFCCCRMSVVSVVGSNCMQVLIRILAFSNIRTIKFITRQPIPCRTGYGVYSKV